ncbi:MAG: 50S ribosomal protein L11 methyltransferase, partial [Abditibacteriota bacterium]|nr:50S ribosomal protein L11 methyltransferase [Abditibacteriota bacterium]
ETEIIEEEDWANSWKRFYKPFRLGCFVIKPSWEPYSAEEDEKIIELDPGMAFGTGQHATTALCLGAVEDYVRPGDTVIDAGTGSGILTLAAHLIGATEIHAFDCDTVAVKTANQNFEAHGMDVRAERAFDAGHISVQADVVLANIIASVILYMADSLAEKTKPGGVLAASGIIMSRDREVFEALTARGFEMLEKRTQKEWVCYIMKKKLSQGALNDDR